MAAERADWFPSALRETAESSEPQLGWRMAVLPFRNLGAPIGYGIALGMAEEISAALARFRVPRLIATATFWDGRGPAADAWDRCKTFQIDYVVDGTIQVIDDRIRVVVTLLDVVLDFEVVWCGHFEGALDDLFSLQDRIAHETVAQVDPTVSGRGWEFNAPAKTEIAAAHQAVLTAIKSIFRLDRPKFMRARNLLLRATELDPEYAAAHTWMAYWSIMAVGQGWVDDPQDVTTLAGVSAERALFLDSFDARAVAIAGHVKGYLLHDVRSALVLHARAIKLSPNLSIVWTLSSFSKIYNGEHVDAVRHAMMSQSLSPRDPHIFFTEHALMMAYLFQRQLDEAEMLSGIVLERNPGHKSALNGRLAILGHLGRKDEAALCLAMLQAIEPIVTISKIVGRAPLRPEDAEYYADGLQRAGVPN